MSMQIIETGDNVRKGIGFFSVGTDWKVRSLFAIFWNRETEKLELNILFIQIELGL